MRYSENNVYKQFYFRLFQQCMVSIEKLLWFFNSRRKRCNVTMMWWRFQHKQQQYDKQIYSTCPLYLTRLFDFWPLVAQKKSLVADESQLVHSLYHCFLLKSQDIWICAFILSGPQHIKLPAFAQIRERDRVYNRDNTIHFFRCRSVLCWLCYFAL